ncbi:acyl-CoA dehydrogenase family protein [Litorimonas sp. WD9-15]|uniref:acyl-CoA dehydrogenase family protein n=1 Tax=Litorimonas sp. WD9-15 TaxID=3418716 RepID=UPI003D03CC85
MISVEDFAIEAEKWFAENTPAAPDFMLPLTFMEVGTDEQFEFLRDWQRKVYEAGFLGAAWPSEYGGGGLTDAHQSAVTKVMRKLEVPIMMNTIGLSWAGPLILDIGSEAHKKKYIKGILSADDIWCQGFSEPENGSDLGNAQLRAVRDGDDYVLNGSKIWTTHGHYAKYMILLARTNPDAPNKYAGLSFILTPMDVPGVETRKIRKLTGEHGFTQTFFTDARAPADGLMGNEGEGWKIAMRTLEYERGARGGQAGGYSITEPDPLAILDLARETGQINDPVVQDDLIDFIIDAQTLSLNQKRAKIGSLMRDKPAGLPLMDKLVKTEFAREINQYALTLQGTRGAYYVDEPNAVDKGWWHRNYLNAFSATIGGGTSQIQRNIIGEHVLGLPKSY